MLKEQETCEQVIDERLKSRFDDFENLSDFQSLPYEDQTKFLNDMGYDMPEDEDEASDIIGEIISEYPLAVVEYKNIRIELSAGGPSDYLNLLIDPEAGLVSGTYHYSWAFDTAARVLDSQQLDIIENIYSYLWDY